MGKMRSEEIVARRLNRDATQIKLSSWQVLRYFTRQSCDFPWNLRLGLREPKTQVK